MAEPKASDILKAIAELSDRMERKFAVVDARFDVITERLNGIDRRLDEQGRYIAALIPTRLAAVPAGDERRAS